MQFKDRARHGVLAVFSSAIALACVVILLVVSNDEVSGQSQIFCILWGSYLLTVENSRRQPSNKVALSPPRPLSPGPQLAKRISSSV
jgi:hypothetical protein